jgi:hypothetical protein
VAVVDENKLAELFNDAVRDAPPPSFDVDSVRAGSHRATVRRRSAIALGSTMAAVLVIGGVALGTGGFAFRTDNATVAASDAAGSGEKAAEQPAAPYELSTPDTSVERGGPTAQDRPEGSSTQGVESSGNVSPPADGTPSGCGTVDRELANALAGELSVASDQASPAGLACPVGSKSASFDVAGGRVFAVVVPGRQALSTPQGAAQTNKLTKNNATLYVVSESPQFADKVEAIAAKLRGKF